MFTYLSGIALDGLLQVGRKVVASTIALHGIKLTQA